MVRHPYKKYPQRDPNFRELPRRVEGVGSGFEGFLGHGFLGIPISL